MPLAASSARVARRWARSALSVTLAFGLAGTVAACSDDDPTSPSSINGTYEVVSFDGASATSQGIFGSFVIDGNEWSLEIEDVEDEIVDQGVLSRSGSRVTFFSDVYDDEFPGTVSGTTLTIDYNLSTTSSPDVVRIVFRR